MPQSDKLRPLDRIEVEPEQGPKISIDPDVKRYELEWTLQDKDIEEIRFPIKVLVLYIANKDAQCCQGFDYQIPGYGYAWTRPSKTFDYSSIPEITKPFNAQFADRTGPQISRFTFDGVGWYKADEQPEEYKARNEESLHWFHMYDLEMILAILDGVKQQLVDAGYIVEENDDQDFDEFKFGAHLEDTQPSAVRTLIC